MAANGWGLKSFEKTCTTSAVAEALGTGPAPASMKIQTRSANSGSVFIGGSNVSSSNGYLIPPPAANQHITLADIMSSGHSEDFDLAKVFIVTTVNGEGVRVLHQVK